MIHESVLIDNNFENTIKNIVIASIFPKLNAIDKDYLLNIIVKLLNTISICFHFDLEKKKDYIYQLTQNDYADVKFLIKYFLPYVSGDYEEITSFNDIYIKKHKKCDINKEEPKYVFSNLQYNRCIRNEDDYKERNYDNTDFEHNFYLFVESVKMTSNKLHTNWTDILPYTLNDYQTETLYKNTRKAHADKNILHWDVATDTQLNLSNDVYCYNLKKKMNSLYIGHIYEEIANLYYSIKSHKWILYDTYMDGKNETMLLFVEFYFDLNLMFQNKEWVQLESDDKKEFIKNIDFIKFAIVNLTHTEKFSQKSYEIFIASFIVSYDMSNYRKHFKNSSYVTFNDTVDNKYDADDVESDDEYESYSSHELFKSFDSLENEHIYGFLSETLQKLKHSFYGCLVLNGNKKSLDRNYSNWFSFIVQIRLNKINYNDCEIAYEDDIDGNLKKNIFLDFCDLNFTLKMIYSFSKSLIGYTRKSKYIKLPILWQSLTNKQKLMISDRINGNVDPLTWFDISRYIKRFEIYNLNNFSEQLTIKKKIKITNLLIYKFVKYIFIDIVFISMIHRGILTKFVPNKNKTDKTLQYKNHKDLYEIIFEESDDNKYWRHAYNYLTHAPYEFCDKTNETDETDKPDKPDKPDKETKKCLQNQRKIIKNKEQSSGGLFDFYLNGTEWYILNSYNWMVQIGFCHHFIHNRITFITGDTGVGKTSEIPKLYMYFSNAIDNKLNVKIACLQPRKNIIDMQCERMANSLGVPMNKKNYYIQKHHGGNKENEEDRKSKNSKQNKYIKTVNHSYIRWVTGDIMLKMINDPFLKEKYKLANDEDEYFETNLFDIIIIDESHEHKKYMDVILSFLKISLTLNNSLRLVIISATMEHDEPKYRRFYRDITDNQKYPLNASIQENKIDRINVDRRFHIFQSKRFRIIEHYSPNENYISIINQLNLKSLVGDIIIFQPGRNEIMETVNEINLKIKNHKVIALPYYSDLPDDKKYFIEKLDENTKCNLKIEKNEDFSRENINVSTGNGNYERIIIVATNIAEASITINTLKYVIDFGTEKVLKFNFKTNSAKLLTGQISESSRIQRRGRVGRVSDGEVFYLYKNGSMENNKARYEMTNENIYSILYKYIRSNTKNEDILMIHKKINDHNHQRLKKQYMINNKDYLYYGNDDCYDYINYNNEIMYYKTGLCAQIINDSRGKFFIFHPCEEEINRNINGDIVGSNSVDAEFIKQSGKYAGSIKSKKMEFFWKMLIDYLYICVTNDNDKYDFIKTEFGNFFMDGNDDKIMDDNQYRMYTFGIASKNVDVLKFCAINAIINEGLGDIFLFPTAISNVKSDIQHLIDILNALHKKIGICDDQILESKQYFSYDKMDKTDDVVLENNDNFATIVSSIDEKYAKKYKKVKNIIFDNIKKKISDNTVEKFCESYKLNFRNIKKYLTEYYILLIDSFKLKNKKFVSTLSNTIEMKNTLTQALLFGYPYNVCKKIKNKYVSIYNETNAYTMQSSMIDNLYLHNYLIFIRLQPDTGEFYLLHTVTLKDIEMLSYIYYKELKHINASIILKLEPKMELYTKSLSKNKIYKKLSTQFLIS